MTAVVLLPGMDGTGALFAEFVTGLGNDCTPIIVSYPGKQALGYHALTEWARPHLPTDRPFVLPGESFSGPVAIALAASRPAGLAGLVLCCSITRNPLPLLHPLRGLTRLLPLKASLAGLIAPFLLGRFSTAHLRAAVRHALNDVAADTLRHRLREVLEVDFSERLKDVLVPVLYLQATEDRVVPSSAAVYLSKLAPTVRVESIEAPHLLLQAQPAEAARIVAEFAREATAVYRGNDYPGRSSG
jgi:pimeloyl-[acyl-carrier protein] methyl ester esterase